MQSTPSKKALIFSAILHIFVLLILMLSLEFSASMPVVSNNDAKVINAVALKDSPIIGPPPKAIEEKRALPEAQEPPKSLPEKMAATEALTPKSAAKEQPAKAPAEEKKIAIADKSKKINPVKKLSQKELSKQLLADLEDEIAKHARAKQKLIKKKFSQALKRQSEKALQQLMQEQQLAGERSQHMRGVVDKYKALILQAISQQWVVPGHVDKRLSCEMLIHLAPNGAVLDVQVTKSSGDVSLDRSARAAVFKASPLPVPDSKDSFEPFRQFVLKVKPENVIDNKTDPV